MTSYNHLENHLTELQLSMHADGATSPEDAAEIGAHLESCSACRAQLSAFSRAGQSLVSSLKVDSDADDNIVIPKFSRPTSLRNFALANVATGLSIWLAQFLWKTIFGELVMNGISWVTSIYVPDFYAVASASALYYLQEGTAMFDAYLGLIVTTIGALTVLWLLLMYRKSRAAVGLCLMMVSTATLLVPQPVSALEIMQNEGLVTVAEGQTIDDTLVVAGETVLIKGDVTGDLVAAGRRIEIDGSIGGNVFAFGEIVSIRGEVGGLLFSGASNIELTGTVGGNMLGAGEQVTIDDDASVASNAALFGRSAVVDGDVMKDLYAYAEIVELSGTLGEDFDAFANRIRMLDGSHVNGDARLRLERESQLDRADGATIDGKLEFLDLPEDFEPTNRYASGKFYLWQFARLMSAILVGLALLWLIPGLRKVSLTGGVDGLKAAGIGLVALVSIPVIATLVAITLIGLPFSVLAMMCWIVLFYLAKIVVGIYVGGLILGDSDSGNKNVMVVLAGMAAVMVAINIPAIGGIISFIFTIIGIGLIVQYVFDYLSARQTPEAI